MNEHYELTGPASHESVKAAFAKIIDGVSENDRRWFEAHPKENVRHRSYVPGECGDEAVDDINSQEGTPMVEVLQLAPGLRTRRLYFVLT